MSTQLGTTMSTPTGAQPHTRLHALKWLLRREFWENKGSMFVAPLVVGALLVMLIGGGMMYAIGGHHLPTNVTVNGHTVSGDALGDSVPMEARMMMAQVGTGMYLASSSPLLFLLAFAVFFYSLGALYDERRDRSILFWKSLPVSDGLTVLSKALTAMVVAPAIVIVIATAASLIQLLLACAAMSLGGLNMFSAVLASPNLYLSPLALVALLPVYIVWALPSVGWLMLVSSWARSKPFLWAVGVPVVTLVLVKSLSHAVEGATGEPLVLLPYVSHIVASILGGVVPGIWFTYDTGLPVAMRLAESGAAMSDMVGQSYRMLATPGAWIGAAAGVAMLVGAVRLRRWRDEG